MASYFGRTRKMVCPGCGICYDKFSTGMSFKEVRNLIISIHWCTKKNKIKHGRRTGTLGYWHELKMAMWDQHVGMCTDAAETRRTA